MPWTERPQCAVPKVELGMTEVGIAYHDDQKQSGRREAAYRGRHSALLSISLRDLSGRWGCQTIQPLLPGTNPLGTVCLTIRGRS
jgi:hypothetical protein